MLAVLLVGPSCIDSCQKRRAEVSPEKSRMVPLTTVATSSVMKYDSSFVSAFRDLLVQNVTNTSLTLSRVRVTLEEVLDGRLDLLTAYRS
jgi:hypothetical protein